MSGNVWEWTRSRWGERSVLRSDYSYPYDRSDGREQLGDMKIPVLRSCSWSVDKRGARCASRGGNIAGNFSPGKGFRLVVYLDVSET
jgi:formylglycine-generating enzyme required for sulfatase activity